LWVFSYLPDKFLTTQKSNAAESTIITKGKVLFELSQLRINTVNKKVIIAVALKTTVIMHIPGCAA